VSDLRGGNDIVIDAASDAVVTTISLGGEAGNTKFDTASGHIFVAAQSASQLAEIDPSTDTIVARYETTECVDPHGLAIDATRRMAFVACEGNDRLLVMDMESMSFTNSYATGHVPDVLAFEPQRRMLYVAAEDGVLSAFRVDSFTRGRLDLINRPTAGANAHSVAVDTNTGHIFLPTIDIHGVSRDLLGITAHQRGFCLRPRCHRLGWTRLSAGRPHSAPSRRPGAASYCYRVDVFRACRVDAARLER
jgi:DNA-binding beta-propeller fold protein YncE